MSSHRRYVSDFYATTEVRHETMENTMHVTSEHLTFSEPVFFSLLTPSMGATSRQIYQHKPWKFGAIYTHPSDTLTPHSCVRSVQFPNLWGPAQGSHKINLRDHILIYNEWKTKLIHNSQIFLKSLLLNCEILSSVLSSDFRFSLQSFKSL